ncbi:MAG: sigma-70 family RNA polymerase sigma factor, partial [Clostridia bacterium]
MDIHTLHILTDEQLVKMAQEGSETAEEILIEKYKSLVKNKAKTYYIAGADNEDVVQEGMIGIFKAIRSYDANKEAAFKTYADTCINNQILSAIKKANRRKHQPLNESIPLTVERVDSEWGETNTEEAGFVKGTMESNPEAVALLREIAEVLQAQNSGVFSNFERQVWAERLKGYAYTEIAAHLGKSP